MYLCLQQPIITNSFLQKKKNNLVALQVFGELNGIEMWLELFVLF